MSWNSYCLLQWFCVDHLMHVFSMYKCKIIWFWKIKITINSHTLEQQIIYRFRFSFKSHVQKSLANNKSKNEETHNEFSRNQGKVTQSTVRESFAKRMEIRVLTRRNYAISLIRRTLRFNSLKCDSRCRIRRELRTIHFCCSRPMLRIHSKGQFTSHKLPKSIARTARLKHTRRS